MSPARDIATKIEVDSKPAEPIRTQPKKTGRTIAEIWANGALADQRAMLANSKVTVLLEAGSVRARLEDESYADDVAA